MHEIDIFFDMIYEYFVLRIDNIQKFLIVWIVLRAILKLLKQKKKDEIQVEVLGFLLGVTFSDGIIASILIFFSSLNFCMFCMDYYDKWKKTEKKNHDTKHKESPDIDFQRELEELRKQNQIISENINKLENKLWMKDNFKNN